MPAYCIEKFERTAGPGLVGQELKVYWVCTKHTHDATLITAIEQWLGTNQGGTWSVRVNSYQSNQSKPPTGGIQY